MATRTQSRSSNRSSNRGSESSSESRSAFSFGGGSAPIIAAALGGVAIGFAANYGRKALMVPMIGWTPLTMQASLKGITP